MHFAKQTKFELMRWGRERAAQSVAESAVTPIAKLTQADEPTVPTMEVDGVLYREAPRIAAGINECKGCEFVGDGQRCCDADEFAVRAFGGLCYDRDVIYLRAE